MASDYQKEALENENIFLEEINNLKAQLNETNRLLQEKTDAIEKLEVLHENLKLELKAKMAKRNWSQKACYNQGERIHSLKAAYQTATYRQTEFEYRQQEREKQLLHYIKNLEEAIFNRPKLVDRGCCPMVHDCNDCKSFEHSMSNQDSGISMSDSDCKNEATSSGSSCQTEDEAIFNGNSTEFLGETGLPIALKFCLSEQDFNRWGYN